MPGKVGAPVAQTLWAWTVKNPIWSWKQRDLLPTQVTFGVGQTDRHEGPHAEGQGCCQGCCAKPNPGAVGPSLPPSFCPDSPTPRHT